MSNAKAGRRVAVCILGVLLLLAAARVLIPLGVPSRSGSAGAKPVPGHEPATVRPSRGSGSIIPREIERPLDPSLGSGNESIPAIYVSGHVQNEDGEPVGGASLVFDSGAINGTSVVGTSLPDGTFSVVWSPARIGHLRAELDDGPRSESVPIRADARTGQAGIALVVQQSTGRVRIGVVTPAGAPVAGAKCSLTLVSTFPGTPPGPSDLENPPLTGAAALQTGVDGVAETRGLRPGVYAGTCAGPETSTAQFSLEVAAGGVSQVRVVLSPGGTILVRTFTSEGTPASNIRVTIEPSGGAPRTEVTDAAGSVEFEHVEPGQAVLVAESGTWGCAREPCVVVENTRVTVEIPLSLARLIRGVVIGVDGRPVAHASVTLHCSGTGRDVLNTAVTGSDGEFAFGGVPDLPHSLAVRMGPEGKLMARMDEVYPSAMEVTVRLEYDLSASAHVTCRLFRPDGRPCGDADLWVESEHGDRGNYVAAVDEGTASATVSGILPGRYSVTARSESLGVVNAGVVILQDGESRDLGDLVFGKPGRLELEFQIADRVPVTSARVRIHRIEEGERARGIALAVVARSMAWPLSAGHYRVTIDGDRVRGSSLDVQVEAGETVRRSVALQGAARRRILVRYEEGLVGPPSTWAVARDAQGNWCGAGMLESQGSSGESVLGFLSLPVGVFDVAVGTLAGGTAVARVQVVGDGDETTIFEGQAR